MNEKDPWLMDEKEWRRHMERVALENERNREQKMSSYYGQRRDFYTYGYDSLVQRSRMNPFAIVDPDRPYKTLEEYDDFMTIERRNDSDDSQVKLNKHFFKVDIPQLNQNN